MEEKRILFRNSIYTGIIASVLFTFLIQPFVGSIWTWLQSTGIAYYQTMNDRIYSNAAIGYREDVDRFIIAFIIVIAFSLIFAALLTIFALILQKRSSKAEKEGEENGTPQGLSASPLMVSGRRWWVTLFLNILSLVLFLWFAWYAGISSIMVISSTELNASFQHRLNIIAPFLTEDDEELLVSDWASMSSQEDFEQLMITMETAATENGIELPDVLWPDVYWDFNAWYE